MPYNREVEFIQDEDAERAYDGEPTFTRLASEEGAGRPWQQQQLEFPYLDRSYTSAAAYPERPGR